MGAGLVIKLVEHGAVEAARLGQQRFSWRSCPPGPSMESGGQPLPSGGDLAPVQLVGRR
jgi:hypothetical protein